MSKAWKSMNLSGGGLQAANIALSRALKRRSLAYALLIAFPLGLHRFYLLERLAAWTYVGATAAVLALVYVELTSAAMAVAALAFAAAIHDGLKIEARLVEVNKAIRRRVFLSQTAAPPVGFRGRNLDAAPALAATREHPAEPNVATQAPQRAAPDPYRPPR